MKKIFNYSLFFILLSFVFINCVNAECSYQERKQLLNEAKAVDISVEPILNENNEYDFKFTVVNITKDFFIKYYNTNNGEENIINYELANNGVFSFVDKDSYSVYDYKFEFYSTSNNCYADKINFKSITKPMYNMYSENVNCTYEENKGFKYCAKFLTKDDNLSIEEFYEKLLDYNSKKQTQNNDDIEESFFEKYIVYIFISFGTLIFSIIVVVLIKKRREKL